MQLPVRLSLLIHPSVSAGILLATGLGTLVFVSTPFMFPLIAEEYEIGLGFAAFIGTFQLGGFVLGSWGSGRRLSPRRGIFVAAVVLAIGTNLLSALLPIYPVLIVLRFLSGISMGIISWFGWVQVFGDESRMGEIAVIGPIVVFVASPIIAVVANSGGASGVFLMLGIVAILPLLFARNAGVEGASSPPTERHKAVLVARVLLASLGLFTMGGSAVFMFAVVIGKERLGLSAGEVAWVFSFNAACSAISAGHTGRRGIPGPWLATTGFAAIALATASATWVFALAAGVWGFAFWMGIPGVFKILADRSEYPQERAGDAQAVMAVGRAFGPLAGGILLQTTSATLLGLLGGGLMIFVGILVFSIRNLTDPQVVDSS